MRLHGTRMGFSETQEVKIKTRAARCRNLQQYDTDRKLPDVNLMYLSSLRMILAERDSRNENIGAHLEDLCKSRLNEVRLSVK